MTAYTDSVTEKLFSHSVAGATPFLTRLEGILNLLQFFSNPLFGAAADQINRKFLLLLSLAGISLEFLLNAWYFSFSVLYLTTALRGIFGITYTIGTILILDYSNGKSEISMNLGKISAISAFGFMMGAIGGIFLAHFDKENMETPFLVAAVIEIINFMTIFIGLPWNEAMIAESSLSMNSSAIPPPGNSQGFSYYLLKRNSMKSRGNSSSSTSSSRRRPIRNLGFFTQSGHFFPSSPPLLMNFHNSAAAVGETPVASQQQGNSEPPSPEWLEEQENQQQAGDGENSSLDSNAHGSSSDSSSDPEIPLKRSSSHATRTSSENSFSDFLPQFLQFLRSHHPLALFSQFSQSRRIFSFSLAFWFLLCGKQITRIFFLYSKWQFQWDRLENSIFLAYCAWILIIHQGFLLKSYLTRISGENAIIYGILIHFLSMIGFSIISNGNYMYGIMFFNGFSFVALPVLRGMISEEIPKEVQGKFQGVLSAIVTSSNCIGSAILGQALAIGMNQEEIVEKKWNLNHGLSNQPTGVHALQGLDWSEGENAHSFFTAISWSCLPFMVSALFHLAAIPFLWIGIRAESAKSSIEANKSVEIPLEDFPSSAHQNPSNPSAATGFSSPNAGNSGNYSILIDSSQLPDQTPMMKSSSSTTILNFMSSGELTRQTSNNSLENMGEKNLALHNTDDEEEEEERGESSAMLQQRK